jgi:hypothetical protein
VPDRATIAPLGARLMAAAASGSGGNAAGAEVVRRHVVLEGAPHNAEGYEAAVAVYVGEFLDAIAGGGGGGGGSSDDTKTESGGEPKRLKASDD